MANPEEDYLQRQIACHPVVPTAQASSAEVAATPSSTVPALRFGLGTCFQVVPFQCRIRVSELPWLTLLVLPTAQAFRAEVAATAESRALAPSKAAALGTVSWAEGPGVVDVALLRDGPM